MNSVIFHKLCIWNVKRGDVKTLFADSGDYTIWGTSLVFSSDDFVSIPPE